VDRIQAEDSRVLPFSPALILPVLLDVANFSTWWPSSIAFTILKQTPDGVGSEVELRPFGANAFCCRIEKVDAEKAVHMNYFKGIYQGSGVWSLEPEAAGTRTTYAVDLAITSFAVRMMARMVDVKGMHSKLMSEVFDGLTRVLENRAGL
jgi:ribosome-associated toxin RatA of RatAB toxin-antitoxin module